jgi:hypothetical protein
MVFYYQMIYSPETNNYNKTRFLLWLLVIDEQRTIIPTLCINMAWCSEAFCTVYPPPLSDANCPPFPPPGGPGPLAPPASKMASISPGSTHIPSTPSVTVLTIHRMKTVTLDYSVDLDSVSIITTSFIITVSKFLISQWNNYFQQNLKTK